MITRVTKSLLNDGPKGSLVKLVNKFIDISDKKDSLKDILFIDGCSLDHPARYRVSHQIEQLHYNNISCDRVWFEDLQIEQLKKYQNFIFFRTPVTDTIKIFIKQAKEDNKTVFYDIDDLVFANEYVDTIEHLKSMNKDELDLYYDGVRRMGDTLKLSDYAITTTESLANELQKYTEDVYISRNVASDKMVECSEQALAEVEKREGKVVIGYLSGSITHNQDFELIKPAIIRLLESHNNVIFKFVGLLDVPEEFTKFGAQVEVEPFVPWQQLPKLIAELDINISPLTDSLFNEAKSENKWLEAALVKVPTVASNIGAFKKVVESRKTGLLCDNTEQWYESLVELVEDKNFREKIGLVAYEKVQSEYRTQFTGAALSRFIFSKIKPSIGFIVPSTQVSGGVNVIKKHAQILKIAGYNVTLVSMDEPDENVDGLNVVSFHSTNLESFFEKLVATFWGTKHVVDNYSKVKSRYYLVQNYETDFYPLEDARHRKQANSTYTSFIDYTYVTISKWCQQWLKDDFDRESKYARNGIDLEKFSFISKDFSGKLIILVEGNSLDEYKNVDESFKIVEKLNQDKFEIWYLSYAGKPKSWYKYDKFFHKVDFDKVAEIYKQAHILLKSSKLESFSYPPLEMMATGGVVLVAENGGNIEYLTHEQNCLMYDLGDIDTAVNHLEELTHNGELRNNLISSGLLTAKDREWSHIEEEIKELYR